VVARELAIGRVVVDDIVVTPVAPASQPSACIRVAAVGIHVGQTRRDASPVLATGVRRPAPPRRRPDQDGTIGEAEVVVGELRDVGVPIVAVLGNHDSLDQETGVTEFALRRHRGPRRATAWSRRAGGGRECVRRARDEGVRRGASLEAALDDTDLAPR
jgi:hypothetical protein